MSDPSKAEDKVDQASEAVAKMNIESKNQGSKGQGKKQQKQKGGGKDKKNKGGKATAVVEKNPAFLDERLVVFDRLFEAQEAAKVAKAAEKKPITITLPDGAERSGIAWVTTPMEIAESISKQLAKKVVAAKVNDAVWDMHRPLEEDCTFKLLTFDDEDGKHVFWHSSAHVLGQAMELFYGAHLCIGPAVEQGFYYDAYMGPNAKECGPEGTSVNQEDLAGIESLISRIVKEKQPFQRLVLSKTDALEMFKYNEFKMRIIQSKVADGDTCTVYRNGKLIDICRGPHVPDTSRIKAVMVTKNSSSYWLGNAENESLQRIYGISFPETKQLKAHKQLLAEAAKRDHRVLGQQQELFMFHKLTGGSAFFLPHGARVYNKLIQFLREQYITRGYEEVHSPNIYDATLWKISGHWQNYQDGMFTFKVEGRDFGLKPMNCPGHCLMFQHRLRSYRELPIRMADFGVLHRNELSGALSGLTRVRRFQQDDAHIFCRPDQVKDEIFGCLDFMKYVYGTFGFTFDLVLSTRPEKYMGDIASWDAAEKALSEALDQSGWPWKTNPGDGAFYGPKIDIYIMDAITRRHQCATVQLDFQLPKNFGLVYTSEGSGEASEETSTKPDAAGAASVASKAQAVAEVPEDKEGKEKQKEKQKQEDHRSWINWKEENDRQSRPVMVHRAILGSVERFMAILIEHTAGKWPFWVSPRQAMVVPVSKVNFDYAEKVRNLLHLAGYYVDADLSERTLNRKIREAQLAQCNFILVVGEQEMGELGDNVPEEKAGKVNVRTRDNVVHGTKTVSQLLDEFKVYCDEHTREF